MKNLKLNRRMAQLVLLQRIELANPLLSKLRKTFGRYLFSKIISKYFINLKENPLGSVALSGTSFNIDRNFTTKKLGFKTPTSNSIDTVSDRDFVLDFLFASSVCAMHISRLAEEFIIWNSDAFKLITLNDSIVTGSSIMPQKKKS